MDSQVTFFMLNRHNSTLLEPNELEICMRGVFDMLDSILMVPGSKQGLNKTISDFFTLFLLSFFPQHIVVGLLNFGRKQMVIIAGFPFSGTPP